MESPPIQQRYCFQQVETPLIRDVKVTNFRTARDVSLDLEPISAFIGEPGAGKSNMLAGIVVLLDPEVGIESTDVSRGHFSAKLEATLSDGRAISTELEDDRVTSTGNTDDLPGLVVLPAHLRDTTLLARTNDHPDAVRCADIIGQELELSAPRVALVRALERCAAEVSGVVFVVEEPELFLAPQGHRHLRRLFHELAESGNQVLFTTHSPGLLDVSRLEEIHLVSRDRQGVTAVEHLQALDADDEFRALCEFDAERAELFFSRAAVLVEGMSEKQAFPYVFRSLGYDVDKEAFSIVDCGGKTNLPLFVEICRRAHIPYVMVFDSDIRGPNKPSDELLQLNRRLRKAAGRDRYVELNPDLEGVLHIHGKTNKPKRVVRHIRSLPTGEVPTTLRRVVEYTVAMARPITPSYS